MWGARMQVYWLPGYTSSLLLQHSGKRCFSLCLLLCLKALRWAEAAFS
jgi:hypothetical protein